MKSFLRALTLLAAGSALLPAPVLGAEPEKVVVRNRLYTNSGKLEAGATVGFTPVTFLVRHTNLGANLAYNLDEQWALEVAGGWALSSQTSVAESASVEVVQSNPSSKHKIVDDFEDLWQMSWNATLVARWSPIYGKVNVAAELPVHFNAYLLAGGGVGGMERDSLVYCMGGAEGLSRSQYTCRAELADSSRYDLTPLHDSAVKPVVVGGAGLRFFLADWAGLRLEVRDFIFADEFLVNIDRAAAERDSPGAEPAEGTPAPDAGLTHLVFLNVGATFTF
jgi:outer membrane beta-barrel protein